MATPTTAGSDRACPSCGSPAEGYEYFCYQCNARLPDPPHHEIDVRRAGAVAPGRGGWAALLSVLGVVVVFGGVIAVAVVVYLRIDPFAPDPSSPSQVVADYFEAAEDDDCARAVDLETSQYRSPARCQQTHERLGASGAGVIRVDDDLLVEDQLVIEDRATVKIRLTRDDTYERCVFSLRLVDDAWRIADSVCETPTARP